MKHWTINFDSLDEQEKLELIVKVCSLGTTNSVSKDDMLCMLRYMADNCIKEDGCYRYEEAEA